MFSSLGDGDNQREISASISREQYDHRTFEVAGLAHYSFQLASKEQAALINPKRDIDTYLKYARKKGLEITHVLETHIHADYLSGAKARSPKQPAELLLSAHDEG